MEIEFSGQSRRDRRGKATREREYSHSGLCSSESTPTLPRLVREDSHINLQKAVRVRAVG